MRKKLLTVVFVSLVSVVFVSPIYANTDDTSISAESLKKHLGGDSKA